MPRFRRKSRKIDRRERRFTKRYLRRHGRRRRGNGFRRGTVAVINSPQSFFPKTLITTGISTYNIQAIQGMPGLVSKVFTVRANDSWDPNAAVVAVGEYSASGFDLWSRHYDAVEVLDCTVTVCIQSSGADIQPAEVFIYSGDRSPANNEDVKKWKLLKGTQWKPCGIGTGDGGTVWIKKHVNMSRAFGSRDAAHQKSIINGPRPGAAALGGGKHPPDAWFISIGLGATAGIAVAFRLMAITVKQKMKWTEPRPVLTVQPASDKGPDLESEASAPIEELDTFVIP